MHSVYIFWKTRQSYTMIIWFSLFEILIEMILTARCYKFATFNYRQYNDPQTNLNAVLNWLWPGARFSNNSGNTRAGFEKRGLCSQSV